MHRLSFSLILISIVILAAMMLHAVEFDHHHPSVLGEGIQATLHSDDRKRLFVTILAASLVIAYVVSVVSLYAKNILILSGPRLIASCGDVRGIGWRHDLLMRGLRRGIIHPKLCD